MSIPRTCRLAESTGGWPAALGAGALEVLRAGALCNDSSLYQEGGHWRISGDPTEGALVVSAAKAGIRQEDLAYHFPRLDTVPFESSHQYMATLHGTAVAAGPKIAPGSLSAVTASESRVAYVKGAAEKVMARCSHELADDGTLVPVNGALDRRHGL